MAGGTKQQAFSNKTTPGDCYSSREGVRGVRLRMKMSRLRGIGASGFNLVQRACLSLISYGLNKERVRRDLQRGSKRFRWFTADEEIVAEALARIIVPSDEETPGIAEVGILDRPAMVALDDLIIQSSYRQDLYARGLLSFDVWAQSRYRRKFADLPTKDQTELFADAQHLYEQWTQRAPLTLKLRRRFQAILQAKNGSFFAAQLYPQIREDCLRVFYTSRVSWVWLGYDGPPMDKGYPNLLERR